MPLNIAPTVWVIILANFKNLPTLGGIKIIEVAKTTCTIFCFLPWREIFHESSSSVPLNIAPGIWKIILSFFSNFKNLPRLGWIKVIQVT